MTLLRSLFRENMQDTRARLLRKEAYELDPHNPDILYWRAYDFFLDSALESAFSTWQECLPFRKACGSGYVFLAKELSKEYQATDVLASLPSEYPNLESLQGYLDSYRGILGEFWTDGKISIPPNVDMFTLYILEQRQQWLEQPNAKDSIWYLAWKVEQALDHKEHKKAFQIAAQVLMINPDYTKMYAILAEYADKKDANRYWQLFLEHGANNAFAQNIRTSMSSSSNILE